MNVYYDFLIAGECNAFFLFFCNDREVVTIRKWKFLNQNSKFWDAHPFIWKSAAEFSEEEL